MDFICALDDDAFKKPRTGNFFLQISFLSLLFKILHFMYFTYLYYDIIFSFVFHIFILSYNIFICRHVGHINICVGYLTFCVGYLTFKFSSFIGILLCILCIGIGHLVSCSVPVLSYLDVCGRRCR